MEHSIIKRILAVMLTFSIVLSCAAVPPAQAEAASSKAVKSVKLQIGSKKVSSYTMTVGQKVKVKVVVTPKKAKKSIVFKSSKATVASVNKKGQITAKKAGKAKITVIVTGKNKKKKKKILKLTVNNSHVEDVSVTSIDMSVSPATISVGQVAQVKAVVMPDNAVNKKLTYSSSLPGIATVNDAGAVVGVSPGTSTITATAVNGVTAQVKITVKEVAIEQIEVIPAELKLTIGATSALKTNVLPENATNKAVNWYSENERVASVSVNGVVTGLEVGTAKVYAVASDGSGTRSNECTVTVIPNTQIEDGISLEVTNPYKDAEGNIYENTALVGREMNVRVMVNQNNNPLGNATVTLTLEPQYGNARNEFALKGVNSDAVTTDENGVATFSIGLKQDFAGENAFSGKWQSYKLTARNSATNTTEEIPISFAGLMIDDENGVVSVENGRNPLYPGIEVSQNAKSSDDGIHRTTMSSGTGDSSYEEEYVTNQQYSTAKNNRTVYLSVKPQIALPATYENVKIGEYEEKINKSSGQYSVYNTEMNETTTTVVTEIPAGLEYLTLKFDKVKISEYTMMYIDIYDMDGESLYHKGVDSGSNDTPNIQIENLKGNPRARLVVSLVSQGLVDASNEGYILNKITGTYANETANRAEYVELKNTVKWEEISSEVEYERTSMSLNEVKKYLSTNSEHLNSEYQYTAFVPSYPYTGNAYIEVRNSNSEAVAWYLYPSENNGNNKNVLAADKNSLNIYAVKATEKEATTKGVGKLTQPEDNSNLAIVDSMELGVTNLRATLDTKGLGLTDTESAIIGKGFYSSIHWVADKIIEEQEENEEFFAIEGQSIAITAQLYTSNGDEKTVADEDVVFYYQYKDNPKEVIEENGEVGGEDIGNDNKVNVLAVDKKTDSNGKAKLVLKGENIDFVKGVYAESKGSIVKLSIGESRMITKADIYWMDLGLEFVDYEDDDHSANVTVNFKSGVIPIDKPASSVVGKVWNVGYKVVARSKLFDVADFSDSVSSDINGGIFDNITNASIEYTMTGAGTLTQTGNFARIQSDQTGDTEVTGLIDSQNFGSGVKVTYYDAEMKKHTVTNAGQVEAGSSTQLGLKFTMKWGNNGLNYKVIVPSGQSLYKDTEATVYVLVRDVYSNPKVDTPVQYTVTGLNSKSGSLTTDGKGVAKILLNAPNTTGESVITFTINNDPTMKVSCTLKYNNNESSAFGLMSDSGTNYTVKRISDTKLKVSFTNQIWTESMRPEEFTLVQIGADTKYNVTACDSVPNDNRAVYITLDHAIQDIGSSHKLTVESYTDPETGIVYELMDANGRKITGLSENTFIPSER